MKKIIKYSILTTLIFSTIIFTWFFKYRFMLLVSTDELKGMKPSLIEGYTNKLFYEINDTIIFYLKSETNDNELKIKKIINPHSYKIVYENTFPMINQEINETQSEFGCNWKESLRIFINDNFDEGYYLIELTNKKNAAFIFPIIISNKNQISNIALLAPTSTWVAYNHWGGKSLYSNIIDHKNVYYISNQRPNTIIMGKHDIEVEANIYNWFEKKYDINIYPDNILDIDINALDESSIIILSYHCEYISNITYLKFMDLVNINGKSIMSIGGNQIYWKTKWNEKMQIMECRKDLTMFKNSFSLGGMWKHNLKSEDKFLGVRYDNRGYETFSPYKIILPEHWLFNKIEIPKDNIFGRNGINELGLSGLETDKITRSSKKDITLIAKGQNPNNGGADFIIKELGDNAILSTGSIQSGSGLGKDSVFTQIIVNFIEKYNK